MAFDAIAGDMSGTMMQVATDFTMQSTISLFLSDQCCFNKSLIQLLPEGSTTVCYGGLSGGKVCFSFVFVMYFIVFSNVIAETDRFLYSQVISVVNCDCIDHIDLVIIITTMTLNSKHFHFHTVTK